MAKSCFTNFGLCMDDGAKAGKRCTSKTFRFQFHGWLEFHTGCLDMEKRSLYFNKSGRCMEKNLKNIFQELITKGSSMNTLVLLLISIAVLFCGYVFWQLDCQTVGSKRRKSSARPHHGRRRGLRSCQSTHPHGPSFLIHCRCGTHHRADRRGHVRLVAGHPLGTDWRHLLRRCPRFRRAFCLYPPSGQIHR